MSCPECGWPEPYGRCARCGCFIRPVFFQSKQVEFEEPTEEPEEPGPDRGFTPLTQADKAECANIIALIEHKETALPQNFTSVEIDQYIREQKPKTA